MKNTFGSSLTVTLFGESHGEAVGAVLDGLSAGVTVDPGKIEKMLLARAPKDGLSGARREADAFRILSGVQNGKTTGTPITVMIENKNAKPEDYTAFSEIPRPGHADLAQKIKYGENAAISGGGHASGRLTAPLAAVGGILLPALEKKGVRIVSHVLSLGGISDLPLPTLRDEGIDVSPDFPVISENKAEEMKSLLAETKAKGDTLGGVIETVVYGLPGGVGDPFFDTLEGELAKILFAVPSVKGVEFGDGFALAGMTGSEANDRYCLSDESIATGTNRAGGIYGGISVGMPIVIRTAFKPTPSVAIGQKTLSLKTGQEVTLSIGGRHDTAAVLRAVPVVDSVVAIALADRLTVRFGECYFGEDDR